MISKPPAGCSSSCPKSESISGTRSTLKLVSVLKDEALLERARANLRGQLSSWRIESDLQNAKADKRTGSFTPCASSSSGGDDLYRADHRMIFTAVADLVERGQPPDAVTVSEHLQRQGQLESAGGLPYLARLVQDTPSAANIRAYAKIVRDHALLQSLFDLAPVGLELIDLTMGRTLLVNSALAC